MESRRLRLFVVLLLLLAACTSTNQDAAGDVVGDAVDATEAELTTSSSTTDPMPEVQSQEPDDVVVETPNEQPAEEAEEAEEDTQSNETTQALINFGGSYGWQESADDGSGSVQVRDYLLVIIEPDGDALVGTLETVSYTHLTLPTTPYV